jgi:hypothetical protein
VIITAFVGGLFSIGVIATAAVRHVIAGRSGGKGSPAIRDVLRTEVPYGPSMIIGSWLAIFLAGVGAFPIPS